MDELLQPLVPRWMRKASIQRTLMAECDLTYDRADELAERLLQTAESRMRPASSVQES